MKTYKTPGVVLKGTNYGEADKILTVLTERLGKIKVIARGVRKIKSHLSGSLEPFMLVNLQLHEGKTFFIATGAEIERDYPTVHTDLKKTAQAFFLGELVDRFVPENQKNEEIFELLVTALESLESFDRLLFIRAFELKIVEAAGFKPELDNCLHCKEKITPGNNFWDELEGGIICGDCQNKFHHGKPIADDTIKLFRYLVENNFLKSNFLRVSLKIEDEAETILGDYIRSILERELKSKQFLKMV